MLWEDDGGGGGGGGGGVVPVAPIPGGVNKQTQGFRSLQIPKLGSKGGRWGLESNSLYRCQQIQSETLYYGDDSLNL